MTGERVLRRSFLIGAALLTALAGHCPADAAEKTIALEVRRQEPVGQERFETKLDKRQLAPRETAILICDMWNQHWCASATRRCGELASKMAPLIDRARAAGVHIVHSPSDTL